MKLRERKNSNNANGELKKNEETAETSTNSRNLATNKLSTAWVSKRSLLCCAPKQYESSIFQPNSNEKLSGATTTSKENNEYDVKKMTVEECKELKEQLKKELKAELKAKKNKNL